MRFLGDIEARTDAKGRVFLPATFRKELQMGGEERIILRMDVFNSCLVLYPGSVWDQQMDEMRAKLDRWDRRQQMLYRQFVCNIVTLTLDSNGRFLIPERYRKCAKISHDVHFVGMGDVIEIWDPEMLDGSMLAQDEFADELEQQMTTNKE